MSDPVPMTRSPRRGLRLRVARPPIPVEVGRPMPPENVAGPGRDPRFLLPQRFVDLRGLRTAYFDAGEGPVVLFIHGLAGNVTHWLHVAPELAERCRTIGLDLPGHGETGRCDVRYTVRMYADHVVAFLNALDIDRATIVGHSLGGMVATDVALRHRSRAERLVLVNPAGSQPMPLPVRIIGEALLRPWILNPVLPRVWKNILDNVFYEKNAHTEAFVQNCEATYKVSDIVDISRVISDLRDDFLGRDFAADLGDLTLPVSLVWGEKDHLVPARLLRRTAARLAHVTCDEIASCGHMPIIERPQRVIAAIERGLPG